jgi:hypothetical protein
VHEGARRIHRESNEHSLDRIQKFSLNQAANSNVVAKKRFAILKFSTAVGDLAVKRILFVQKSISCPGLDSNQHNLSDAAT